MKNPDYDEAKAHLPNAEDLRRWNNGGKKKHDEEEARKGRVLDHYGRVAKAKGGVK